MAAMLLRALPRASSSVAGLRFSSSSAAAASGELPKFSVVRHQVTADTIRPEDHFAVVKLGGTQYKVTQVGYPADLSFV